MFSLKELIQKKKDIKIDYKTETDTVQQVFFFYMYYLIYVINIFKNGIKVNYKGYKKYEIKFHLVYMFMGILTIKFSIYLLKEFDLIKIDYPDLLNEPMVIFFYIQAFSLYLVYALIIYFIIKFKHHPKNLFKALFVFGLKIFNITYPLFFIVVLYLTDKIIDTGKLDINFLAGFAISLLLAFSFYILVINTIKLISDFYKIKYKIVIALTIVFSIFYINYKSFEFIPFKSELKNFIHIESLCKQKTDSFIKAKAYDECSDCKMPYPKYIEQLVQCEKETKKMFDNY